MSRDAFLVKLAEILQADESQIDDNFKLDYDNWDSVAHLAAIAAIDEQFDIILPAKEITRCATVGELMSLIGRHTNSD